MGEGNEEGPGKGCCINRSRGVPWKVQYSSKYEEGKGMKRRQGEDFRSLVWSVTAMYAAGIQYKFKQQGGVK